MRMRFSLLSCVLLAGCVGQAPAPEPENPAQDEAPIIGGTVVSANKYRNVGYLDAFDDSQGIGWGCTVSLIRNDGADTTSTDDDVAWVLTAAHCVYDATSQTEFNVSFDVGPHEWNNADQYTWFPVTSYEYHEDFVSEQFYDGYDIAVMRLGKAVPGTTPVSLRSSPLSQGNVGDDTVMVGYGNTWGGTDWEPGTGSGTKRETTGEIESVSELLVDSGDTQHGTCQGDSGGPLFRVVSGSGSNAVLEQIGVTSFGPSGCVDASTFTSVPYYVGTWDTLQDILDGGTSGSGTGSGSGSGSGSTGAGGSTGEGGGSGTGGGPVYACGADGWASEPDAMDHPNALCDDDGTYAYGLLESADDEDWYTWEVAPDHNYRVNLATFDFLTGYRMELWRRNGATTSLVADTEGGSSSQDIRRYTTTGGTYFLKVWSGDGSSSAQYGYAVTVSVE